MAATERKPGAVLRLLLFPCALAAGIACSALLARSLHIGQRQNPLMPGAAALFPLDIFIFVAGWWLYLLLAAAVRKMFMRLLQDPAISLSVHFFISGKAAIPLMAIAAFLRALNYLTPVESASQTFVMVRVGLNLLLLGAGYILEAARYKHEIIREASIPAGRAVLTWFSPALAAIVIAFVLRWI